MALTGGVLVGTLRHGGKREAYSIDEHHCCAKKLLAESQLQKSATEISDDEEE